MRLTGTPIEGAFVVEPERLEDERGHFARTFCSRTFASHGLCQAFLQSSLSYNACAGTLRGMHCQRAPHEEAKLVRCTRGSVYDVVADVRAGSRSLGAWHAVELSAGNALGLYVPAGVAHGFITLEDRSEVLYDIAPEYHAAAATGFRWDDPELAIRWPRTPVVMSGRDRALPSFAQVVREMQAARSS